MEGNFIRSKIGKETLWRQDKFERGRDFEILKDANIAGTFPVIDDFRNGCATSYKTIDLKESVTYRTNPKEIFHLIRREHIEPLRDFKGRKWGEHRVKKEAIRNKVLCIGIPFGITDAQQTALREAGEYAMGKGISLIIDFVR